MDTLTRILTYMYLYYVILSSFHKKNGEQQG